MKGIRKRGRFTRLPPTLGKGAVVAAVTLVGPLAGCEGDGSGRPTVRTLEVHESSDLEVTVSPDGDRLAITLLGGLWTMPDTGGRAERVTPPAFRVRDPAWAPTGSRIALVAVEGGTHSLKVVDAATGEARELVSGAVQLTRPAWSPDADRLVYSVVEPSDCDLWSVPLTGGSARRLTQLPGCEDSPVWFDDRIVFAYSRSKEDAATATDLWTVSAEGGDAEPLLRAPGDQRPVAGGYGGSLLYLSSEDGKASLLSHPAVDTLLHGLPPAAGRPVPLPGSRGEFVVREEGRLWRVDTRGGRTPVAFRAEVEVRRPAYERRAPEIELDSARPAHGVFAPRLAPDGRRVAFSAMGDIWVAPLDGSVPPRAVVSGPAEQTMPAWAPDGRRLAYASNQAGDLDLWVVSLEGGEPRRLTSLPGDEREPAWDPTGRRIAFSFFDNETVDLFWVSADGDAPVRVTRHDMWHWDLSPAWGPDGQRVAFLQRTPSDPVPTVAIASVEPAGTVSRLQLGDSPVTAVAWSPREELAYRSAGKLQVVAVDSSGTPAGPPEPLGDVRAFHPSFDADGGHLLYLSPDGLRLRARPGDGEHSVSLDLAVEPPPPPPPLTIRRVQLVDGTGRGPRGPVDITIEEGRIVSITPSAEMDAERRDPDRPGAGAVDVESPATDLAEGQRRELDGSGLTALPGLIDMHTHLFHYGLRAYLGSGVTTVRDVGFESHLVASRWEGILSGRLRGPRVVYAGEFLDEKGGPWMGNFVTWVATPEEVRREVARLADVGAGWIKTYVRMSPELRRAAIEAAHAHGLPATQHEIYPAVAWGADGKEHVRPGFRQDLRAVLAASGAVVVPTLETGSGSFVYMRDHPEVWDEDAVQGLIPAYVRSNFRKSVQGADSATARAMRERHRQRLEVTSALHEEGARLVVGTDPTNPFVLFGIGVHWELEHLVEAGLDPLEAIHMATGAAAEALHLEDRLGTVEPGKLADLILVEGDPATEIRDTRRVRWVVFGGEPLRPGELHLEHLASSGTGPPASPHGHSGVDGQDR